MISKMSRTRMGASPREGSSNMTTLGRPMSPRPMASICCSPPDSVPAAWRRRSFKRGKSSKTSFRVSSRRVRASPRRLPMSRFSSTLISTKRRLASGTWAMPSSMSRKGSWVCRAWPFR